MKIIIHPNLLHLEIFYYFYKYITLITSSISFYCFILIKENSVTSIRDSHVEDS